jgi:hypothetical protein
VGDGLYNSLKGGRPKFDTLNKALNFELYYIGGAFVACLHDSCEAWWVSKEGQEVKINIPTRDLDAISFIEMSIEEPYVII